MTFTAPHRVAGSRPGFTLLELLVVIAIMAIMLGLLVAAVQRVRASAARLKCLNNLKQIGLALHAYHGSHGRLPPGVSNANGEPYPFMSWNARLLPFLEQEGLWKLTTVAYAQQPFFLANPPHVGLATLMPVYLCPSDGRIQQIGGIKGLMRAYTSYLGVEGTDQFSEDGVLYLNSTVRLTDISDGTSNTLMVGERPPSADGVLGWWYAGHGQAKDGSAEMVLGAREQLASGYFPGCISGPKDFGPGRLDNQCDALHFWSLHPGGANFLFADGSARFLTYSVNPLMPALATRADGEVFTMPD
jgi:prepilin-type N-terminal cleavage/methylation domain-containing protein/prepilin-type processing-associated H-X9-DG protein